MNVGITSCCANILNRERNGDIKKNFESYYSVYNECLQIPERGLPLFRKLTISSYFYNSLVIIYTQNSIIGVPSDSKYYYSLFGINHSLLDKEYFCKFNTINNPLLPWIEPNKSNHFLNHTP